MFRIKRPRCAFDVLFQDGQVFLAPAANNSVDPSLVGAIMRSEQLTGQILLSTTKPDDPVAALMAYWAQKGWSVVSLVETVVPSEDGERKTVYIEQEQ